MLTGNVYLLGDGVLKAIVSDKIKLEYFKMNLTHGINGAKKRPHVFFIKVLGL